MLTNYQRKQIHNWVKELRKIKNYEDDITILHSEWDASISKLLSQVNWKLIRKLNRKCRWRAELESAKLMQI